MTVQILGIRTGFDKKTGEEYKYDAFFEDGWRAPSVIDLLAAPATYLAQVPPDKRWNIYYTTANCTDNKREFLSQEIIAIDIDGGVDLERLELYRDAAALVLGISKEDFSAVSSGNGLHIIIALATPIKDADFFKKNRHHYKAILAKIDAALAAQSLPGKCDPSIFDRARILRLPGTLNRKPNKPEKPCKLVHFSGKRHKFDLAELSGLPQVKGTEQVPHEFFKKYPKVDHDAVMEGCSFIRWAHEHPGDVTEPQWYAALSVVGKMEDGHERCHKMSEGHPKYKREETDTKIAQALESSGPRTCENINAHWGKCSTCPNFQKVKSPILLVGEGHIATEHTGFHDIIWDEKTGLPIKRVPNIDDMARFFTRVHKNKGLAGSKIVMVWRGTHYSPIAPNEIDGFCEIHFDPKPKNKTVDEVRGKIIRSHLRELAWFTTELHGKINLQNGYLDIETMTLHPATPELGFRYVLPYAYDPKATCPTFIKMMRKICMNDAAMVMVLQEFFGYCVSGETPWAQKALVLKGGGSNGKTTLLNILKAVVGRDAISMCSMKELERSEYARQMLDGKLFNISEETPTKAMADTSLFKAMVSGGDVNVRLPYRDPYTIQYKGKMIFSCNDMPESDDTSWGYMRRLLIAPCDAKFSESDHDFDPFIEDKIKRDELPGVLNWVIDGLKRLKAQGHFTHCAKINAAREDYSTQIDNVKRWVKENVYYCIGEEAKCFTTIDELYSSYFENCLSGNEKAISKIAFGRRLPGLINGYAERFKIERKDGKAHRGLFGVKFAQGANLQSDIIELHH